ncbi:MAG TPA: signal recognition particle protein [Bacteroidia bacterium]|jgi:signal recognition particle subunit SRP54|nr:signal recognition particle protein [Bacteroidia bacterium]
MFESLTERLNKAFQLIKGENKINELNITETLKEIRKALLDADVNYQVARDFTERVKQKALGQQVVSSKITAGQLLVKITHDELVELMGGTNADIHLSSNPSIFLMAGLQGSGKTTFSAKLAKYLKTKKSKHPLLIACDVYRPAAIDQLRILGNQIGVEVFSIDGEKNPIKIAEKGIEYAKEKHYNAVIIDTAGRLSIDEEMMNEISLIKNKVQPHEILLVVDAMTGQDAVNTAKAFNERLSITGVVLSKMDGDTRGGAALSIKSVVQKPIKFISQGEKLDALDIFYPDRMADRILGMGDIVTLVEKAQQEIDENEARKFAKKMAKNQLDFEDMLTQIRMMKKLGGVSSIASLMPGLSGLAKNMNSEETEKMIKRTEAVILSMTPEERRKPELINHSRKMRIANGSGTNINEVNRVIKMYDEMKKLAKMMSNKGAMAQLMKMFPGLGKIM